MLVDGINKNMSEKYKIRGKPFQKGHKINLGRKRPDVIERNKKSLFQKGNKSKLGQKQSQKEKETRIKTLKKHYKIYSYPLKKEKSPFWQGGKSFEPYGIKFNKELKERIRKRDKYTCQECKYTEKQLGYKLSVHHIDYNKQNNEENNLISLCRNCHAQTNYKREDWTNYFNNNKHGSS